MSSEVETSLTVSVTNVNEIQWPAADSSALLLAEKSNFALSRQKKPERMQQCLSLRAEPQGHRSFRPSFSTRCLFPCTTRTPRLTRVSDW